MQTQRREGYRRAPPAAPASLKAPGCGPRNGGLPTPAVRRSLHATHFSRCKSCAEAEVGPVFPVEAIFAIDASTAAVTITNMSGPGSLRNVRIGFSLAK